LDETSECHPDDAYGASKLKAEKALLSMQSLDFAVAVVRPPLVYGPRVKGNMIRLLHLAAKKYPLPLGNSRNARSMVFVDNLVALINALIDKKATGVFIAGDEKPVETSALIKMMRVSLDNSSPLVSIPQPFRMLMKKLKPALYVRLFGSFVVDNASTNNSLDFRPPFSTEQGVAEMVSWFKKEKTSLII
jgi:UDP-glucose 4-epimerase